MPYIGAKLVLLLIAAWLWLTGASPAHAGFIVPLLIPALAGTFLGGVISFGVTVIASIGLSYVASTLLAKNQPDNPVNDVGGTSIDVQVAADVPMSLIVGRAALAGSLAFAGTYGKRGDVDNSDLIEIIALADHPCEGLFAAYVEGLPATLTDTGTDRGFTVNAYSGGLDKATIESGNLGQFGVFGSFVAGALESILESQGKLQAFSDLVALKFFDGTQTAADPFTVAALAGATDQPWNSTFVGTGVTYARVHSIYDREKVPGRLRWRWVVDGIRLYDPRKDSSVGGSGSHRWGTESTYEWSQNVAVIIYNIVRGIYVNGQFFYGIEGTTASQLPFDVWVAAMNECDVSSATADGGTEPQYTAGGEITVDTQPLDAIKALLLASGGRFVEIGGIYKLYLGAPGAPVVSFDDGSLLANKDDTFKPVLALNERINYITGQYTSPQDGWLPKIAPLRGNPDWETEDGRRLPADLNAAMVQSGTQLQRLQLQMLNRSRQQRAHVVPLPPQAMILEPGDTVSWDSVRNGYDDKLFEVEGVDYDPNLNVSISIREVDPNDYDYNVGNELPEPDGHLITKRPAPKVITGFDVLAFVYLGDVGTARPAIRISWDDPEDNDAAAMRWQIRLGSDHGNVESGSTDDVTAGSVVVVAGLQSKTAYEVRARFESFNGYGADWSFWTPITTPEILFDLADFSKGLRDFVSNELNRISDQVRDLLRRMASASADQDARVLLDKYRSNVNLAARDAQILILQDTQVTDQEAFAEYQVTVATQFTADNAAIANAKSEAIQIAHSDAAGAIAAYDIGVQATYSTKTSTSSALAEILAASEVHADNAVASLTESVNASVGSLSASVLEQSQAIANLDGFVAAAWSVQVTAQGYVAGIQLINGGQGQATFTVAADNFRVAWPGITGETPVFQIANVNGNAKLAFRGDMYADGSITAQMLSVGELSAITAEIGTLQVGPYIQINGPGGYILTSEP